MSRINIKITSTLIVLIIFFVLLATTNFFKLASAMPSGANATAINSSTLQPDTALPVEAIAGNVTEINIIGKSTTQTWQGYYGNVSGVIQLGDSAGNNLYNWSLATPTGEVYSSTNDTIQWANIQCFNFTAAGNYSDDTAQAGSTSLYGTNLTQLEAEFNINSSDIDGVGNTFNAFDHRQFFTANHEFSENECKSTITYNSTGSYVFQETLLYEPVTTSVVFTGLIEQDLDGFDKNTHDFQMLVLEDGHGTNVDSTTYYFYVELE